MKRGLVALGGLAAAGAIAVGGLVGYNSLVSVSASVSPGNSWNTAYQQAQPGDTIAVAAGSYSGQVLTYRADLANRCSIANPASLITFDVPSGVTVNGEFEIFGSCVRIKGPSTGTLPKINAQIHTITQSQTQHPDNVIVENLDVVTASVFSADAVLYKNLDIGPATVVAPNGRCYIKEGSGDENKISSRSFFVPRNVTWDGVRIHDQNGEASREIGDCHFGGLFIISADGFTLKNSVIGGGNVVYNIQVQNFSGDILKDIHIENNAFACPAEWAYRARACDGQRSIQFSGSGQYPGLRITGNNVANGVNGTYGCYGAVGSCNFSTLVAFGNLETAESMSPPPLPGGSPPPPPPPIDTEAPSVPGGLSTSGQTQTSFVMSWNASSDNVGVTGYGVYSAGVLVATVPTLFYSFTGLTCGTTYVVGVTALDAAGNESNLGAAIASGSNTLACSPPPPPPPTYDMGAEYDRLEATSLHERYRRANPNEAIKVEDYWRLGGAKPTVATGYGQFLVSAAEEIRR